MPRTEKTRATSSAPPRRRPRGRELHDHSRPRPALHADLARGQPAARLASDGRIEHRAVGHELHGAGGSSFDAAPASRLPSGPARSRQFAIRIASRTISRGPAILFPLVAKEGGVLRRAGHTESAVDLARHGRFATGWRACARSSPNRATGPTANNCTNWPAISICRSFRSSS